MELPVIVASHLVVSELSLCICLPGDPCSCDWLLHTSQWYARACLLDHRHLVAAMLLRLPQPAHSPCKRCSRQQSAFARVTSARRCCKRSARTAVVDTVQVIAQDVANSIKDQPDVLVNSQLNTSRADPDMNSRVQVPRNKVLTTTMIAHATNKDVNQVM